MTCIRTLLLTLAAIALATPVAAQSLSTSVMRPTAIDPATGRVAGTFPGGVGATSYYLAIDLQPGTLMTQLEVAGSPHTPKRVDFELLDDNARVAGSHYVMANSEAKRDLTRTYAIDTARRYVVRLSIDGGETNTYCLLMGGSALPSVTSPGCPAPRAASSPTAIAPPSVAPPPPAPKAVEVIVGRCEERLRVRADFLFDFDRSVVRPEAAGALAEVAARIKEAKKAITIEGHTDAKGTESYNQGLSERRAGAVRVALSDRGIPDAWLRVRGFGKSRPVAPNQHADGSDDPDGRQRNRRVEVVINTCS